MSTPLIPTKAYWSKDLLDYFLGTEQSHLKWDERTEVWTWLSDNCHTFMHNHDICRLTDNPHSDLSPRSMIVEEFFQNALKEFGTYDYEFQQSRPCGGWKYLDVIVC